MIEANANILILESNVMERLSTKSDICFLYKFVFVNQVCILVELFANATVANNKNGAVGNTGNATPNRPSPKLIIPMIK